MGENNAIMLEEKSKAYKHVVINISSENKELSTFSTK